MAPSFPKFDRLRAFRTGFRQTPAAPEPTSDILAGLIQPPKPTEPIFHHVQSPRRKTLPLLNDECAVSCTDTLASDVLLGRDRVISFAGTPQFAAGDVSACSLAALNFARITFHQAERYQGNISDILTSLATRKMVEVSVDLRAK